MGGTFWVILVVCISTFAVIATLVYAALDRGKRDQLAGNLAELRREHETEKAELETIIRHYKLLSSAEFREQVAAEIEEHKRRSPDQAVPEREAELKAANHIIEARQRELEKAIDAAGVSVEKASKIWRAAGVDSVLPMLGEALRERMAEVEAMAVRTHKAEAMKRQLAEREAETVRLQMAEDETIKERETQAEAIRAQVEQTEAMKRRLEELEAETEKLRQAKEEALKRQQEEAEAVGAQLAEVEAIEQEMGEIEALQAFRDTLISGTEAPPAAQDEADEERPQEPD
jgi:hypothetical protein